MSDIECPYCGSRQAVCHDDGAGYAEDRAHEQTCSECDKTYVFYTSIHFYYRAKKADCLNGQQHRLERSKTYPPQFATMRCIDCDHEEPSKPEPSDASPR